MIKQAARTIPLKIILFSIIIAIVTLRDNDATIDPGIDAPFRWALNYFMAYHRAAFAHIQYTVGPLCLLKWPVPIGDHLFISTLFCLTVATLFTSLYTWFYAQYRASAQYAIPLLACAVFILVVNIEVLLLGCVLLAILYYRFLDQKKIIIIAVLLTVTGFYIKTSIFALSFSIWLTFSAYLLIKRQFKYLLQIAAGSSILFFLAGYLLLGSLSGCIDFAHNNILFALKYSDLLSLYPYNSWVALGICLGGIALIFAFFIKQPGGFLMRIAGICIFAAWKYSMGREDFYHAIIFLYVLILLMVLFLLIQKKQVQLGMFLFLGAICFYTHNLQHTLGYKNNYYWLPDVVNFHNRILDQKNFKKNMLDESKRSCAINVLPDDWRKKIGTETVDIFPWDLSIIMINGLTYQYRPSLQSLGMNAGGDMADATFLKTPEAPHYIIWHEVTGSHTHIDGLDEQYTPNTCPATIETILTNYQCTPMINERFAVWEKRALPNSIVKRNLDSLTIAWGDWVTIPAHDSTSLIKGWVDYKPTLQYALRSIVYKGLPVFMEYETDSGQVFQYHFSKQYSSTEGLFLDPLWVDNKMHSVHIKRVRFLNNEPAYFKQQLSVVLEQLSVKPGVAK